MKIAIITDIHYGIRSDYVPFIENNKQFFEEIFFPTLKKHDVKTVVCIGDILDRRKYVNYFTAYRLKKDFFDPLLFRGYFFHWIPGNHDIYYRNTLEVNAAEILLQGPYYLYKEATEVEFDGTKLLFVPWICDENREQVFRMIKETKAQILFGHLEIDGFEMNKGITNIGGLDPKMFDKFDMVLSGHFHQKSKKGNIHYLGAHAEFTWADYGEDRGFYIFDTDTRTLEYFKNPLVVFRKVYYDDSQGKPTNPVGGFESLNRKIIKVIVSGKNHPLEYENFMNKVEAAQPLDIQVVDDHLNLNLTGETEIVSESKDTIEIIRDYIKQSNNIVNTQKLDKLVTDLYNEAQLGNE